MILRIPFSFPLPICVLFCCAASLTGQQLEDPFNPSGQNTANPFDPFGQAQPAADRDTPKPRANPPKGTDDEKIKAFSTQLARIQNEYAQMVLRENALKDTIRRLTTENKVNELANQEDVKAALREKVRAKKFAPGKPKKDRSKIASLNSPTRTRF